MQDDVWERIEDGLFVFLSKVRLFVVCIFSSLYFQWKNGCYIYVYAFCILLEERRWILTWWSGSLLRRTTLQLYQPRSLSWGHPSIQIRKHYNANKHNVDPCWGAFCVTTSHSVGLYGNQLLSFVWVVGWFSFSFGSLFSHGLLFGMSLETRKTFSYFPFLLSLTHSAMTIEVGFSFWLAKMLRPL